MTAPLCALLLSVLTQTADPGFVVVDPALHARPDNVPVVATLADAVAWVSDHRGHADRFEIALARGSHRVTRGVVLAADSPPLTIRALAPGARLVGGLVLPDPDWQPVADQSTLDRLPEQSRESVRALTLQPESLEGWAGGLAGPVHRGMGVGVSAIRSELFIAGHALTPARWPNEGFESVAAATDPGSTPRNAGADIPAADRVVEPDRGGTFTLADTPADHARLARWANATDAWVHGYWWWDWADEQIPVASINPEAGSVTLALPHRYGVRDTARFYITNLPEELDAPGEYWVDPATGTVYAWVAEEDLHDEVAISLLAEPMLTLDGASDITIDGLTFECARRGAILGKRVNRVEIARCTFTNLGTQAVRLDGSHSAVRQSRFTDIGGGGVALTGGDRATLTHADNTIEDCTFRRCGRVLRTYNPAIGLSGVGQRVAHNEISDLPHIAIMFGGNEHTIEANRIHHVVQETGDAGAIYCGRDWTTHGTVIRENFFHDIEGSDTRYQNAVYLDDMASGITVESNLFVRCNWGMLVGGGRDNTIRHNAFLACGMAMQYDARGVGWMAKHIADPATSTLHKNLAAVPIDQEPWASRYPTLQTYLTDRFGRPVGGVVAGNALIATPLGNIADRECVRVEANTTVPLSQDVVASTAAALASMERTPDAMFRPAENMPDFPPIPFGSTGPRTTPLGAPTPVTTQPPG